MSFFWFFIAAIVLILLLRLRVSKKNRHAMYVLAAQKRLSTLKSIKGGAQQFAYLRKLNPFVFEEMVLTSLHQRGINIKRNKRYTGDGGVDGIFFLNGRKYLVQAKRYSSYINQAHVRSFNDTCKKQSARGIFIHTGKTGPSAKEHQNDVVQIISGSKLLAFLCGNDLHIHNIPLLK